MDQFHLLSISDDYSKPTYHQPRSRLMRLPAEVRSMILHELLDAPSERVMSIFLRHHPEKSDPWNDKLVVSCIVKVPWLYILACQKLFNEARPLLSKGITLDVHNNDNMQVNISQIIGSRPCRELVKTVFYAWPKGAAVQLDCRWLTWRWLLLSPNLKNFAVRRDNLWGRVKDTTRGRRPVYLEENLRMQQTRYQQSAYPTKKKLCMVNHKLLYDDESQIDLWQNPRPLVNWSVFADVRPDINFFVEYESVGPPSCGGTCAQYKANTGYDALRQVVDERGHEQTVKMEHRAYRQGHFCDCNETHRWRPLAYRVPHADRWEFEAGGNFTQRVFQWLKDHGQ
jgi:hypothetical protein